MELKDILKLVGVEESDDLTIDKVRQSIESRYLDRSTAHENPDVQKKIIGKHFNVLRQGIVNSFGVGEDFIKNDDGDFIEPVDAFKKVADKINNDIAQIRKDASEGVDKRILNLETKLEAKETSLKDLTKMNDTLSQELETVKQSAQGEINKFKVNSRINDIKATFKILPDLAPALKRGIDAEIGDMNWSLDDDGKLQVRNSDGGIIPSSQKASTPAGPAEVLQSIYEKNGALIKNGAPQQGQNVGERFSKQDTPDGPVIAKRRPVNRG